MTFLFVKGASIRCTPSQYSYMLVSCNPPSAVFSGLPDAVAAMLRGRFDVFLDFIAAQTSAWVQIHPFSLCREAGDQGRGEKKADPWSAETAPQ